VTTNTTESGLEVKAPLLHAMKELCTDNRDITLISLCTTDGFNIKSFASKSLDADADKVAAVASSLCALSNSSALQLMKSEFEITIIESVGGNTLFMKSEYLGKDCVVTIASKPDLSLAQARFSMKRFVDFIKTIE